MKRLVVNPIACTGHGVCAELFPERVALDEWGYPIVSDKPIAEHLLAHARRAADLCPTLALLLSDAPGPRSSS
jgi:ferredoxin